MNILKPTHLYNLTLQIKVLLYSFKGEIEIIKIKNF